VLSLPWQFFGRDQEKKAPCKLLSLKPDASEEAQSYFSWWSHCCQEDGRLSSLTDQMIFPKCRKSVLKVSQHVLDKSMSIRLSLKQLAEWSV